VNEIRIRFRPRKPAEPPHMLVPPTDVYQRDDGMYQLGIGDDSPGPFETRAFAADVWMQRQRHREQFCNDRAGRQPAIIRRKQNG
jgi:hypothetical protein